MFFQIIETSSAGNCAFLESQNTRILIDAGIGVRRIQSYLASRNLTLDDIDGVFITHEHSDHCKALKNLTKYRLKVFANTLTAESICYAIPETKSLNWNIFKNSTEFDFLGLKVSAFSIPHDTSDAVGYKIECANKLIVWATDLGKVTLAVKDIAMSANILVLESNYCPKMLEYSSRPYNLKVRIKGSHGHLSNADAIALISSLNANLVEKIYLAHISKECNSVEHIAELLENVGDILKKIEIVSPFSKPSSPFECV